MTLSANHCRQQCLYFFRYRTDKDRYARPSVQRADWELIAALFAQASTREERARNGNRIPLARLVRVDHRIDLLPALFSTPQLNRSQEWDC